MAGIATPVLSVPNVIWVIVTSPFSVSRMYFICDEVPGIAFPAMVRLSLSGRNMLSRLEQYPKAPAPIDVTLAGIVMLSRFAQL